MKIVLVLILIKFVNGKFQHPDDILTRSQVMIWTGKIVPFQSDCIGTLITREYVLTSASCFLTYWSEFVDFSKVVIGKVRF